MGKPGRRREWARATDDTEVFAAVADDDEGPGDGEDDPQPATSAN
jgi:hypothetical protein